MEEDEIGMACSKYVREEECLKLSGLDSKERRSLEDVIQ
jgi:hypothetical protein